MSDTALISLVLGGLGLFVTIITSVMILAYKMGVSAQRIDKLEKDTESERIEMRNTVDKIYQKLEALTAIGPHQCGQIERIAAMQARQDAAANVLGEHEHRMDRIQSDVGLLQAAVIRGEPGERGQRGKVGPEHS